MNIALRQKTFATRAAGGFDRRGFTTADIERMTAAGILGPDEKFELIEGEIVWMMQVSYFPHERIKLALNRAFSRALPDTLQLGVETSLFLSDITFVNPDISIFPMMNTQNVCGADILLAAEVADSSLAKDLKLKADLYARHGVQELWVIDVKKLVTHVFRAPVEGAWMFKGKLRADAALLHASAPGLCVKLAEI